MILHIDGHMRTFTPIAVFRMAHALAPDFGVRTFIPDKRVNPGSIDRAGHALNALREAVLQAVPTSQPPTGWTASVMLLQLEFRRQLSSANEIIGLQPSEIDFAVMGFAEVSQLVLFRTLRAFIESQPTPDFKLIYREWLNTTLVVSRPFFFMRLHEPGWNIRVVRMAYGACGLIVHTSEKTHYLTDTEAACPAEGFMYTLLHEVAQRYASTIYAAARARDVPTV